MGRGREEGTEEVLATFRKHGLVDVPTDMIEWRHFCQVLKLLDPTFYTDAALRALRQQVAGGNDASESTSFKLEALIDHIFGSGGEAAKAEISKQAAALRVHKFTGDVVLSLSRTEASGLAVRALRLQAAKALGRRWGEVTLIVKTRKLEDGELVEELLPSEGVLEVLLMIQQLPQYDSHEPSIGQLEALKWLLLSPDPEEQMTACGQIRRVLSIEQAPPIDRVIELGLVPRLLELCQERETPVLQFEAAWALTNIASGSTEQTRAVADSGGVATFVELLRSDNQDVQEQATWGLGNIAGDSPAMRNVVLEAGAVPLIVELYGNLQQIAFRRNAVWTLSNCCRGKPGPDLESLRPMLPLLCGALRSDDTEILADAAWALSYIGDGPNERIQSLLESGCLPSLVELLGHESPQVQTPVLRAVGNIVTGDDLQTQQAINCGVLAQFRLLMDHNKRGIRKECCWAISNVTAGSVEQIQAVLDSNLIRPLCAALQNEQEVGIRKEAAWALVNVTSGGSFEQVEQIVECGCIPSLVQVLPAFNGNDKFYTSVLGGFQNILKAGQRQQNAQGLAANPFVEPMLEAGVKDVVERRMEADVEPEEEDTLQDILALLHDGQAKEAEADVEPQAEPRAEPEADAKDAL